MSTDVDTDDPERTDATTPSDGTREQPADSVASPQDSETEGPTPVTIERAPPRWSQFVALGAGVVGALLTTPFALLALPFGLAGIVVLAGGLFLTHSRRWISVGTALVLVGTIISGAYGAVSIELALIGVTASVLAWDVGHHGIGIGEQLGRETRSKRTQLVHTAVSAVVLGTVSMVAYTVSLVAAGGRPVSAVALVVAGIVVVAWLFR